ncbi:MAG: papain fold toxin domain-containing protein, partial [Dolichospermum sp.]
MGFGSAIAKRSAGIAVWGYGNEIAFRDVGMRSLLGCGSAISFRDVWGCDRFGDVGMRSLFGMWGMRSLIGMWGCDSEALLQAFHRVEMIFDNHHPDGITRNQWLANLLFY